MWRALTLIQVWNQTKNAQTFLRAHGGFSKDKRQTETEKFIFAL